ncbi:MAG TPA: hypothetical protein VFU59_00145, partial [Candidatus Eisenbacteria bacterium]|nr:hypothetical protein [Candidatus Eisenbacteria bacterium]
LRAVRRWGRLLYDFDGLRTFKARFKPRAWDPIYLSYPRGRSSMGAIRDVLTAFSRGGLLGFGVQTLMRGPAVAMRLLALLLVPWTLLLALPGSAAWFPSEAWRWGWVVFDVLVIAGLYRLSERWRPRLATLLAAAMGLDALLTMVQAVTYTLPRRHGVFDLVVVSVAVLAPAIAAAILWTGRAHRRPA